ncbi:CDP-glycerol glycerophosphotransferase (TagB/SpsB family) [Paenibacillus sp. JGP012]|uniref:CDP-glycerol glycerophosphotransferase family protein n=1 Tax=Paenibacillus sp. JGP012 TaxID=2735914 RepID=UPI001614BC3A|nr:CDP-glycerol glycerophosphotransferase family protein [Paenibacillus sp. JGP012]MBB6021633.1 CDP-glycerol glycerophosphotransferase (TagB/SpsB family) [Paenibacillus sp. JGP012]
MKHILDQIADYINTDQIQSAYNLIIENEESLIHNAEYWNMRGILCLKVDEYNASISCLANAIELEDTNGDYYYNYAYALEKIGSFSDAALYYGRAYKYLNDSNIKLELKRMFQAGDEALENIFMTASESKEKVFILLSSNIWGDVYQRTHHIARSLSKFGNEVLYVERKKNLISDDKNILSLDLLSYSINSARKIDGVKIYSTLEVQDEKNNFVIDNYLSVIQHLLDEYLSKNKEVVIISYLPSQIKTIKSLNGEFYHIYECVDDHSDLKYSFWGHESDIAWEQELMDSADAITTTATALYLQRSCIEKRKNVFLSRNAVNDSDFLDYSIESMPSDLINIPEPRVVYAGAIYEWFDMDLFNEVVSMNPNISFVILGFGKTELLSNSLPNLYFLGEKKHSELKYYLRHMQTGIIPFKAETNIIINCDPIKQYEYLASHLPVITTYMTDTAVGKEYTFIANNGLDFSRAINESLAVEVNSEVVKKFILKNNWNARAALISNLANCSLDFEENFKNERDKIQSELFNLVSHYQSSVFSTLYWICTSFDDTGRYKEKMKLVYNQFEKNNFVVLHYLNSLLEVEDYFEFIEGYSKSNFVREELIEELKYRFSIGDFNALIPLAYLSINKVKEFKTFNITDEHTKRMFNIYYKFLYYQNYENIGNDERANHSPLYMFLLSQMKEKEIICLSNMISEIDENSLKVLKKYGVHIEKVLSLDSLSKDLIGLFDDKSKIKVMVIYNSNYVKEIRLLAEHGIKECEVVVIEGTKIERVYIGPDLMNHIKLKKYTKTVVFNKFNAADSNVGALIKYIPLEFKNKFNVKVIYGKDIYKTENVVKIPLWGSVTVSGFSTFLYLPKFTFNIEVGHAGIILKSCGLMDKEDKNSGGNPEIFKKADLVCVASRMQMIVFSSFYAIPENKYRITGMARNDMLLNTDGRKNIEKLLNKDFSSKKIIFNMPTFHVFERIGRIEGDINLNDSFKIHNFDYEKFDDFLEKNNLVCISKVHHGEETSVTSKTKKRKLKNLHFINNNTLDSFGLDLYEILNGADVLITDYSTVYNDFLFMNKPTVFVNSDLEEYRLKRGLALEPYEFWTAGPKVQTQSDLESELLNSCYNDDYYRLDRERLAPVFFESIDANSVWNTWEIIEEALKSVAIEN